jgi:four helix bundle protein
VNTNSYSDYHNLTAYSKSKLISKQIITTFPKQLPNSVGSQIIMNQLIRATTSVGANIAEGYGRNSRAEYRQFLKIARGSSLETEYWLEIIQESYNLPISDIMNLNKEVIRLLTVTIQKLSTIMSGDK